MTGFLFFLNLFQISIIFKDSVNPEIYIIFYYILIALILGVYMIIFYVSYSFSINRFGTVWPLTILRSVVCFIVTVLFMPIFGKQLNNNK